MEGEKKNIYLDYPVMRLVRDSTFADDQKDRIERDLRFLVLYRFCLGNVNERNWDKEFPIFREKYGAAAILNGGYLSSDELERIWGHKKTIREGLFKVSDYLFRDFFSVKDLRELMMYITVSLADVHLIEGEITPQEKMKFESLKAEVDFFTKVFKLASNHSYEVAYLDSNIHPLRAWGWYAASLCLLIWVLDEKDESKAPKMNMDLILSKLQRNFDRVLPDVTRTCFWYLTATKPSADVRPEAGELVSIFVEFLLRNLKGYLAKDRFELLLNGMILLISFLMDQPPPEENQGQLILRQAAAAAAEEAASLFISIGFGQMNEAEIAEATNFPFDVFLGKVNAIKAEVRKSYPQLFLDSSSFNFPRTNMLRLFDPMIENLEGFSLQFPNHPAVTIYQELVLLRDLLKSSNFEGLQNEPKELKDPCTRVSNVVHQADRAIKSFRYLKGYLWVDMLCLFDVKEEIKHIRTVVEGIQGQHVHDIDASRTNMILSPNMQTMDEVIVGFEAKAEVIGNWLTSGPEKLDIISIIGMPGLGKTTLAKKVYHDSSIKHKFTKCAWCTVSQSFDSKKILLDILNDVTVVNDSFFEMDEGELADRLRKCLKGQKYLIVMDDIWDVGAWNALKLSFPDEGEYGRILFTSRIHDVALRAKSDSFLYHLSPLSKEESWELLEKRLYHDKDIWQRDFVKVGEQIAKDCKGLPLAIVLVAGLLKKKLEDLDWWKQIGENIGSRISEQDCAHILELSYKHLPEPLKACFLYFGLFEEDKVIRVPKLTKLWVSEGFIPKQGVEDVEIVAKEYVMDLVGRSLLIVTHRSSSGGIKACRIHDLLWEFCLSKSEEENFLKVLRGKNFAHFPRDSLSMHCRVSIQAQQYSSFLVRNTSPLHSLLISPTRTSEPFGMDHSSFCGARFLQVLDLEDVKFHGDFPEEVTALILLRYLAIRCTNKLIPPTIVRLEHLETLRVRTEETCVFPSRILEMQNLRHVDIGKFLPYGVFRNARPMKNIQSLSFPHLSYGKDTEIFLTKIPTIRKLKCRIASRQSYHVVANLNFPNHLESLNATSDGLSRLRSVEFSLPSTLKKLTLSNFRLPWTELSRIAAKLPNLEVLKLLVRAFTGKWWNAENVEFLNLKFLKLQNLDIEQWSASHENFPSLEYIIVEQCQRLQEIPTSFVELPRLKMIQVGRCQSSVVKSARKIREEQIDNGNEHFQLLTMKILGQNFSG